MHNRAYLEDDGMAPDPMATRPNKLDRINAHRWRHAQEVQHGRDWRDTVILLALERITTLEKENEQTRRELAEMQRTVKNLSHMMPV